MDVILFGGSGMIGCGVLIECLEDPGVTSILSVGRSPSGLSHPKLEEVLRDDLFDLSDIETKLTGYRACFFCLGVSAAGMSERDYSRITFDLTMAVAGTVVRLNPGLTFCYVSGEGTDSSESGRMMWARVKGKTENQLLDLPTPAYMFRPGFVQPMKGVRSKTAIYRAAYTLSAPLYPVLKRVAARHVTTTVHLGRAMIRVAREGYHEDVLENPDINALGEGRDTKEES